MKETVNMIILDLLTEGFLYINFEDAAILLCLD